MNLAQHLERLDPRERRLLQIFLLFVAILVAVAVPIGTEAMLKTKREESEGYRTVIADLIASQPALVKAEQKRQLIAQRYARPAPPLATFIDSLAKELTLDVPESQDRPTTPHGKRYEERAIRVQLRKVGLANLSKFLEKIETSGYPVVVSKLNIHKRISEPDSYDVELIVSAYDRKELPKGEAAAEAGKKGDGAAAEKPASDARKETP
jgi:general secretion pathway protein M